MFRLNHNESILNLLGIEESLDFNLLGIEDSLDFFPNFQLVTTKVSAMARILNKIENNDHRIVGRKNHVVIVGSSVRFNLNNRIMIVGSSVLLNMNYCKKIILSD